MNYRSNAHPQGACPRCLELLYENEVVGERVLACAKCGGVFVSTAIAASMARGPDRILADAIFRLSSGKPEQPYEAVADPLPCPDCSQQMERMAIPSAVCHVDSCAAHGTWFDAHEFEHVARALANARQRLHR